MPILRSKHKNVNVPDNISVTDFIFQGIDSCLDKVAIKDNVSGEEISYRRLQEKTNNLARALWARGIRKGDVICLFAEKSISATITLLAIFKLGAIMTPCRPSDTPGELVTQLRDSNSKMIIADKTLLETVKKAQSDAPQIQAVFCTSQAEGYENILSMSDHTDAPPLPEIQLDPKKDVATIIYSSGTTGLPKGCMISQYALVSMGLILIKTFPQLDEQEVFFQNAPPFHIGGLHNLIIYLHAKKQLLFITSPPLQEYLRMAFKYKMKMVGLMPGELLDLCKFSPDEFKDLGVDFSSMTFGTGGSVFNASNTEEVLSKTGARGLLQVYGSTEVGIVTTDEVETCVPGSSGILNRNYQLKIVDLNTREILGPNQPGEVCVNTPCMTLGYLNNPEATKQVFDDDGWFCMGDVGYYDDTEHLFITDRIKDVIKYNTMQVSPAEIEAVIYTHPAVHKACVVSVEDDSHGEIPLACIMLKDGQSATEQEIVKLVEDNLADYKRLRGGVRFMKEFPLTSMGKIIRRELRDQVRAELKK